MIYFVVFCLSGFFFQVGEYTKNKITKKVLYSIALMIPVLLSAFRGVEVGKDTSYYAYPTFQYAKTVPSFLNFIGYDGIEPAFLFLQYVGAKIFNSFAFVLGSIQLIINYCFYKTIIKKYGGEDIAIMMMIFYFFIFGGTLNAIRQSAAVSLILLSSTYFSEKRYVISSILFILAFMFHTTAAFSLIFLAIYLITDKEKIYRFVNVTIVLFSVVLNVGWRSIFSTVFKMIPIWSRNYADYLIYVRAGDRNETKIICGIIALIIILIINKKSESRWNKLLISISIIYLFYQPITEKLNVASRLLLYPQAFLITIFPLGKELIRVKFGEKEVPWVVDIVIFAFFFAIWFYVVVLNNSDSILPYTLMQ